MSERIVEWVTVEDLRKITRKDRRTIADRLEGQNFQKQGNKKLYDKMLALELVMGGRSSEDDSAKERKARADAEKAELIVRKLKGELVSVDAMKGAAAELIKTLYARTVRVLPAIVASKLIGKSVIEIETVLREELAEVYNELKSLPENFLSVTDDIDPDTDEDGD